MRLTGLLGWILPVGGAGRVFKLGPYQGGHGCLLIFFDEKDNIVVGVYIDSEQPVFFSRALSKQFETLLAKLVSRDEQR